MGIRFLCPHCDHKLNVKSFLAGKRGVCPRCGRGLDIPLENQIVKGAEELGSNLPSAGPSQVARDAPAVAYQPVHQAGTAPPSAECSGIPHFTPPGIPAPGMVGGSNPGSSPVPVIPKVPMSASVPAVPTTAAIVPRPSPLSVRPEPMAPAASPSRPAVQDPIDEVPEAVWYVRPPSGGQYGPARGDVMRKWIGEGRISADSMVWREGWDDWRSGGDVFPYLRTATESPAHVPAPVAYAPSTPAPAAGSRSYAVRRQQSSLAVAITTVVVLGLMSVALLITLVLVINNS